MMVLSKYMPCDGIVLKIHMTFILHTLFTTWTRNLSLRVSEIYTKQVGYSILGLANVLPRDVGCPF